MLHQQNTWSPLNASKDMVSLLVDHYQLDDGFFEILSGFRDRNLPTEEGFAGPLRSVLTENQRGQYRNNVICKVATDHV